MAAEAPWPSSSSSQSLFGTFPLVLECSPMHASPSLILKAKFAWGSANPAKSSPGTLSYNSLVPISHCSKLTVVQVGSRMDQDMGTNAALAGMDRAASPAWARTC